MYGLSIDQHVVFVRKLMKLRDQDLISPEELTSAMVPRLSTMLVLANYQDEGIQSLLNELEARDDIGPSPKSRIRSILSGEALEERRLFDLECCSVRQ
ncbi:MAG: hypothetical protein CFE30_30275 [Bradyrhizobium sp. PARBB1]|nr:MAG: hypothetical protein CFE30_30275 [Bradyrhizobium sp. PARBB1]PSO27746.1 hypothetical protein C7G43_07225 [Bradyrhizobium sp. MOS004]HAQ79302.1 hypothetical protein [Bradyrhizobium sp.]HAR15260.1 hypothetical protein [Bradyrhizobium sp.]HAR23160.1 hypothetical protein [Bradyrhizobium sp.]